MNEQMSQEVEAQLRDLTAAPDADKALVSRLRSRLLAGGKTKTVRRTSPLLTWGSAFALVLLLAALLAFSPQVVSVMRRLLVYVPGFGLVEKGPNLRVLAEPVTVQKDGLTLTIEQGAADAQHTVLLSRMQGYEEQPAGQHSCTSAMQLVLADGTVLEARGISGSSDAQHPGIVFMRFEFEPMPSDAQGGTLEIPCLLLNAEYPDWTARLHFELAPVGDQIAPVIELPTP